MLVLGQKLTALVSTKVSALSKRKRRGDLLTQLLRFQALKASSNELAGPYASILWYRASRSLIMGLMWLTLGLIFGSILPILGIVGFIGCLYYLFSALNVVRPLSYDGSIDERITELHEKIDEIDKT